MSNGRIPENSLVGHSFRLTFHRHVLGHHGGVPMTAVATCARCGTLNETETKHHLCDVLYTIADNVYNYKKEDAPLNPYPSGYGRKIPTRYFVKYITGNRYSESRWRRVYVMQYGNAGSAYILIGKTVVFLDTNTESKLEAM